MPCYVGLGMFSHKNAFCAALKLRQTLEINDNSTGIQMLGDAWLKNNWADAIVLPQSIEINPNILGLCNWELPSPAKILDEAVMLSCTRLDEPLTELIRGGIVLRKAANGFRQGQSKLCHAIEVLAAENFPQMQELSSWSGFL